MSKEKEVFDVEQGHRDHLDSILDGISIEQFFERLPRLFEVANLITMTEQEISCSFGEGLPNKMKFALLGDMKERGRISMLVGMCAKGNQLLRFYPEYDGAEVEVKLTNIFEWANGVEATLEGKIMDGQKDIAFFDTRYAQRKNAYKVGETYMFRLSAFAFYAEILEQRTFQFTGDDAVKHREKCGMEQEYDEKGMPTPVVFDMSELVAFIQISTAYPHTGEFQSPVFAIKEENLFDGNFYTAEIAIARDDNGDDEIHIPLIVKQSFFEKQPKVNDPIRGTMWLQGYRMD